MKGRNGLTWLKLYDPANADVFLVVASLHLKVLDEVMTGIKSVFLQAKGQGYTINSLYKIFCSLRKCLLSNEGGVRVCGIGLFLVRCCGNFYFEVWYCGFQSPSGVQ